VLTKILGTQVLRDVQTFVSALDTMFGGFRERADYTYQLLRAPGTAFLVVAAPEPDALREASYFVERLAEERMPLAGLILNRVQRPPAAQLSAARSLAAAEMLEAAAAADSGRGGSGPADSGRGESGDGHGGAYPLTVTALRLHADRMQQAAEQRRVAEHFTAAHPLVPVAEIPAQPDDIHDLDGLHRIGQAFGPAR
jgi:anion-transporting  ArsA/GET3 family ATPase